MCVGIYLDARRGIPSQVPEWRGLSATERSVDSGALAAKTYNVGAIYLMALVQADGALLLKCFFNAHCYERARVEREADRRLLARLERLQGPTIVPPR